MNIDIECLPRNARQLDSTGIVDYHIVFENAQCSQRVNGEIDATAD